MADKTVEVLGDEVEEVQVVTEQRARSAMWWTSVMSSFVLRRMCQLISSGVRTDKGFKEVHVNQVAKALQEFTGQEVTGTQVYNHLRKWRQRWMKVSKLRELSGANWDDEVHMITLEDEHYKGHIQAHPKDAEYLNKPIENYQQMEIIFGNGQATGKYAMSSNEALGSPTNFVDNSYKSEPFDEEKVAKDMADVAKMFGDVSKEGKDGGTGSGPSNKRKRYVFTEEDTVVFNNMTDAVKDVASAIHETKVEIMHPDLYGAVMHMPGFNEEALIVAYSHLFDNKPQGDAFMKMSDSHRVLWLRTWLGKHYYM